MITHIDLRDYFPKTMTVHSFRHANGAFYSRYAVFPGDANFHALYQAYLTPSPPRAGELFVWQKAYYAPTHRPPAEPKVATYALLFFGSDQSIVEAGDYFRLPDNAAGYPPNSSVAFGYQKEGSASGLLWSAPGGMTLGSPARILDLGTSFQNPAGAFTSSGAAAYSHVELREVLPTFVPAFGRSGADWAKGNARTYHNVAHLVFHHGIRNPGQSTFKRCAPSGSPHAALYRSEPGYNSYASEYFLAPGMGIVQEGLLYNEQNAYFDGGVPGSFDCKGLALEDAAHASAYLSYVDDP